MTDSLFCALRRTWVAALPEEQVRQALLQEMIHSLGYPPGHMVLEKSLDQLPHVKKNVSLPKRRADLIVFGKDLHPHHALYPLLLVEFKAVPLTDKVLRQLVGYNQFVGAYFIAAVNQTESYLGYYHPTQKDFCFRKGFLPYTSLIHQAQQVHLREGP
jgi:hypothetical protein